MGERKTPFVIGEFYHIYNRGNSKQIIFRSSDDYQRFLRLIKIANTDASFKLKYLNESESASSRGVPLVAIGLYCLMPNHFHILLSPLVENGVSLFMKKVATGYSMYFNNKYERTGSLFEGKFKSKWTSADNHLKYLFAYIHLNPVKLIEPGWKEEGIKDISKAYDFAVSYPYSSLAAHLSQVFPVKDGQESIIDTKPFPAFFSNNLDKRTDLFEWLAYGE
jgi:putative transposase